MWILSCDAISFYISTEGLIIFLILGKIQWNLFLFSSCYLFSWFGNAFISLGLWNTLYFANWQFQPLVLLFTLEISGKPFSPLFKTSALQFDREIFLYWKVINIRMLQDIEIEWFDRSADIFLNFVLLLPHCIDKIF